MTGRAASLRLGAALLALAAGAAAVVVVIALLRSEPGPVSAAAGASGPAATPASLTGGAIATPAQPGFPSPPPGALVLAREAGSDALGLAIQSGTSSSLVRVSVVGPSGSGAAGLRVAVAFGNGALARLAACGAGCYQAELPTGGARSATVSIGQRRYGFVLPGSNTSDAGALVARAATVWRALKTLVWHERLAGSPTEVIHTVYEAIAPDELSYAIRGLSSAVIIGGSRWDRPAVGQAWVKSVQNPRVEVPVPFWYSVADARLLGTTRYQGAPVWNVSFFDPTTPAWFEALIDRRTDRTLELWMTAASHFMHHVYGPFNAPLRLEPPASG